MRFSKKRLFLSFVAVLVFLALLAFAFDMPKQIRLARIGAYPLSASSSDILM